MTNKSYCNRWEPLVEIKRVRWELCVARLFFTLLVTVPAARCGDAPQWMHAVANAALPDHDEKTNAVLVHSLARKGLRGEREGRRRDGPIGRAGR